MNTLKKNVAVALLLMLGVYSALAQSYRNAPSSYETVIGTVSGELEAGESYDRYYYAESYISSFSKWKYKDTKDNKISYSEDELYEKCLSEAKRIYGNSYPNLYLRNFDYNKREKYLGDYEYKSFEGDTWKKEDWEKRVYEYSATVVVKNTSQNYSYTNQSQISWNKTSHNFGVFKEEAGLQTTVFEFTNVGGEPLVITNVKGSGGCITDYTRESIPQGKKGFVKVSYNPINRPGKFSKQIIVTINGESSTSTLTIKGDVAPREKGVEDYYPKDFCGLRLKTAHLALNNVLNTEVKTGTIGVVNMTEAPMKVTFQNVPKHINIKMVPATLAAKKANDKMGQEGNIIVTYDAKQIGDFGFRQDRILVVVNDSVNAVYKITVSATIVP